MFGDILAFLKSCLFLIGYVSSHGSFPQPMPSNEEKQAIEAMMKGDDTARMKLIEHNLRLVAHIAKKYHATNMDQDDLISIGSMGLIKAVRTYKPDNGTALATYAARCIENEILMALRTNKKTKDEVSLSEPIGTDRDGKDIDLIDVLGTEPEMVEDEVSTKIDMEKVSKLIMSRLNKREKTVVELRYGISGGRPVPQREIAALIGISRSYVSRIEKKALEKLAEGLEQPGN